MKKLFVPALAIFAMLMGSGCDLGKEKVTSMRNRFSTPPISQVPATSEVNDRGEIITTDEVTTSNSSVSNYGVDAGTAALGDAVVAKKRAAVKKVKPMQDEQPINNETAQELPYEFDYERQSMEEGPLFDYPIEDYQEKGFMDERLDQLERRDNIFYGNPGASGSSGSPSSSDLYQ